MIRKIIGMFLTTIFRPVTTPLIASGARLDALYDLLLTEANHRIMSECKNPLNKFGKKIFSQTDEDGITIEILRRIGIKNGTFAEFGVGNGLENNTLVLTALGWTGFWVGNEQLAFTPPKSSKLQYYRQWITLENIVDIAKQALSTIGRDKLDVASLDLDGNDYYLVEKLLSSEIFPSLFIVEYNAKFAPPIQFKITYDPTHSWNGDDYFGASLATFNELFERFNYSLVCCNSHTGANAFFVRQEHMKLFADVPKQIDQIYAAPRYLLYRGYGHKKAPKTVESILEQNSQTAPQELTRSRSLS
jgi:hypothetical protein